MCTETIWTSGYFTGKSELTDFQPIKKPAFYAYKFFNVKLNNLNNTFICRHISIDVTSISSYMTSPCYHTFSLVYSSFTGEICSNLKSWFKLATNIEDKKCEHRTHWFDNNSYREITLITWVRSMRPAVISLGCRSAVIILIPTDVFDRWFSGIWNKRTILNSEILVYKCEVNFRSNSCNY